MTLPNHIKLLAFPVLYAQGAIESLEKQLASVKSSKRRVKLEQKLSQWKTTLEILQEKENEKSETGGK
jgi:hypothetical protein